jgi:CheY-like chemotaxis protein
MARFHPNAIVSFGFCCGDGKPYIFYGFASAVAIGRSFQRNTILVLTSAATALPLLIALKRMGARMRICIIDDNAMLSEALSFGLRDDGHEVLLARDGVEGAALVQSASPDIVLIDWNMPGVRGDQVAEQLRALGFVAIIILMSGGSARDDLDARVRDGLVDHFMEKPFTPKQLISVINALTAQRAAAK